MAAAFAPVPDALIFHNPTELAVSTFYPCIPAASPIADVARKRARTTAVVELYERGHPNVVPEDIGRCVLAESNAVAVAAGGFAGMPPWAVLMMNTLRDEMTKNSAALRDELAKSSAALQREITKSNAALQGEVANLRNEIWNHSVCARAATHNVDAKLFNAHSRKLTNPDLRPLMMIPQIPPALVGVAVPRLVQPSVHPHFPADYDALRKLTAVELRALLDAYGGQTAAVAAGRASLQDQFQALIGIPM